MDFIGLKWLETLFHIIFCRLFFFKFIKSLHYVWLDTHLLTKQPVENENETHVNFHVTSELIIKEQADLCLNHVLIPDKKYSQYSLRFNF